MMTRLALVAALTLGLAAPLAAQDRRPSHCIALADATPGIGYVRQAGLPAAVHDRLARDRLARDTGPATPAIYGAPLDANTVRLNYVAHATFLIEVPDGTTIATDYTGFLGTADLVPTVVTMNKAHGTHFTDDPDPRIAHVLRGWNPEGTGPADHYIEIGETRVRNVTTDLRPGFGDVGEPDGNSIFVFEVAGLCIAHLGHLHHEPTEAQYAALGRMDVVMAPVDGGYTLDLPTMLRVLKRARASVVIPMHWFSDRALGAFLDGMKGEFLIEPVPEGYTEVGLRSLPSQPTVRVLQPRWLRDAPSP